MFVYSYEQCIGKTFTVFLKFSIWTFFLWMRGKRKIRRGRKEKKRRGRRGEINKKRKKEEKEEEKKKGIEEKKKKPFVFSSFFSSLFLLHLFFLFLNYFPFSSLSRRCRYNPLEITSTWGAVDINTPPRPSRSTKTLEDTQTLERKRCWSPTPSRRAPTRQINSLEAIQIYQVKRALSSRPPQTFEALLCRGDPKP